MTSDQAFEILGITDRNIDEASLRRAFHDAARLTHPDSNPDDANAQNKFNMINEAYKVLCAYLEYEKEVTYKGKKVYTYDWSRHAAKPYGDFKKKATDNPNPNSHAWQQKQNNSWRQTETDPWDRYAQADKLFEKERKRQEEAEHRRQEKLEKLKREAEYQHQRYLHQEMLKEQKKKKEEESDRIKGENEYKQNENKRKIIEVVETGFAPELMLGVFLLIGMIVIFLSDIFTVGRSSAYFVKLSTIIFASVLIIIAACRLTVYVRRRKKDELISIITFLATLELGIALSKIIETVFSLHMVVELVLIMVILWSYEALRGKKAARVLMDQRKHIKYIILAVLGEYITSTVLAFVVILIQMLIG